MNKFILTKGTKETNADIFMRIVGAIQKNNRVKDIWEGKSEIGDWEKKVSFKNIILIYNEDEKEISLNIDYRSMSIDKQVEIFKVCNDVVLAEVHNIV